MANIKTRLVGACIHAKTVLGILRPTDCLCDSTMVTFCDRCRIDIEIASLDAVIKEAKP